MGPRQFKTCVYSSKPCDDLTGPGPPSAVKKVKLKCYHKIRTNNIRLTPDHRGFKG